jgi:hypothetical protein
MKKEPKLNFADAVFSYHNLRIYHAMITKNTADKEPKCDPFWSHFLQPQPDNALCFGDQEHI